MEEVTMARRRRPVQKRGEDHVDHILATTARLIAERGADAVTTSMIAESADISVGSIYRYFAGREQIFNAVMQRGLDELDVRLYAVGFTLAGPEWYARSRDGIHVMVDWARDSDLAHRSLMYTSSLTGTISATNRAHDLRLASRLAAELPAAVQGSMKPTAEAVVAMYLGILDKGLELAFHASVDGDPVALSAMETAATTYIARYLDR